jgi:hypothetical protein
MITARRHVSKVPICDVERRSARVRFIGIGVRGFSSICVEQVGGELGIEAIGQPSPLMSMS